MSDCTRRLQAAQEAVEEVLHARASRDRLVAAADQQASYQSYVPAAISGMGAAVANAASSIVGGGDVSAARCSVGTGRQAGRPSRGAKLCAWQAGAWLSKLEHTAWCAHSQVAAKCWGDIDCPWTACLVLAFLRDGTAGPALPAVAPGRAWLAGDGHTHRHPLTRACAPLPGHR